ncbi:MAG: DUF721 domain-containing protein [Gammaproteobacteria bacterium]|nr:DUF721 domain-containing protein [Gammaproteobacteria bacterium]
MGQAPQSPLRSIREHLTNAQHLQRLRERTDFLRNITAQVNETLGPPLAGRFAVARCEPTQVVIVAHSPAWATRLRFASPDIAAFFADHFNRSRAPRVDIRMAKQEVTDAHAQEPSVSQSLAYELEQRARQINDPRLARTLRSIAERADPKNINSNDGSPGNIGPDDIGTKAVDAKRADTAKRASTGLAKDDT